MKMRGSRLAMRHCTPQVWWRWLSAAMLLAGLGGAASASSLTVQVVDRVGAPLADAVVFAEPAARKPAGANVRSTSIEQIGRQFVPQVSVVQVGTAIAFPNNDTVRHHVYSFSPAKTFDIKLYLGVPASPVVFEKPGLVVLGCNIHDKMVAYVHVVDTPHFGKTDAKGQVRIDGVPVGSYQLKVWHAQQAPGAQPAEQPLSVKSDGATVSVRLEASAP